MNTKIINKHSLQKEVVTYVTGMDVHNNLKH